MDARKTAEIEVIGRGVYVRGGRVLLCRTKGAENTYLPGGHVEFGEPAARSVEREIREELGCRARVGRFLGAVEHTFVQKGRRKCEVNLVFSVSIEGVGPLRAPASCEDYIEFLWVPMGRLRKARLEPSPLCRMLPLWRRASRGAPRWSSTFRRNGDRQ
jgi:8-oxo-dGTP diphosphatase